MNTKRGVRIRWAMLGICGIGWALASGAEPRTSVGDRPVLRTASYSAPPPMVEEEFHIGEEMPHGCDACSGCGRASESSCQRCCLQMCGTWVDFDFLLGWRHGIRLPPLVTTSPQGTPDNIAGRLDQATTRIIYPTEPVGEEGRPGGRITLGTWLDPSQCWGVEGRYFALAEASTRFDVTSNGDPILARPFFNLDPNVNNDDALLVAFPGLRAPGNITVETESDMLGGDALLRRSLCRWGCGRLDLLVGYQFARIDESLLISSQTTSLAPPLVAGTFLSISDSFITRNEYHAATFGAMAQYERGPWRLDLMGKIGFGNMSETVVINGQTVVIDAVGNRADQPIGLLAQAGNEGTFTQDEFCVSPEINVKLVYHVTQCVDVSAGYTFVYWSNLVEPGQQIDPTLRVPPLAPVIRDTESWIHALTLGASFQF